MDINRKHILNISEVLNSQHNKQEANDYQTFVWQMKRETSMMFKMVGHHKPAAPMLHSYITYTVYFS